MSVEDLTKVVSPPKSPLSSGDEAAWTTVQKDLGIVLPEDLRDIGSRYGTGRFYGTDEPKYERWDLPMTTFLAKVFTNEIKCILWKGFTKKDLTFKQVDF